MRPIDWWMTFVPILLVIVIAAYTRRYIRSVADFVAGGRAAGRYLICNARGEAGAGVANTMSYFQLMMVSGFVLAWWNTITIAVWLLIAISGFVVYRFRQTRAMTVGQFFEMRYSRRFRLFAGVLGFVAGLLNYGIFPAVSSKFFVYFLGLPQDIGRGAVHVPTYVAIMAGYLACALWMMIAGGQITMLVTNCLEGILSHLVYLVVIAAIFTAISWAQMRNTLLATVPHHSLVNPFDAMKVENFNLWYVLITLLVGSQGIYCTMAVQKDNNFTVAARTPHEARMGNVLGNWRLLARYVMLYVVVIGAMTFMRQPNFPGNALLQSIHEVQVQDQMQVPIALRFLLPAGVKGLFCAMMILGLMAGDSAHMLTWGNVFIQDIVLPLRSAPLSQRQHVLILRLAVCGVAGFAFVFSIVFRQTQFISMWWAVTEGIFVCGAGAAIIGGLYWKKGTVIGAWSAIITGSVLALFGIVAPYVIRNFPFNGTQMKFFAAAASSLVYIVISLLTCRRDHDMDRLLNRGRYAFAEDQVATPAAARRWTQRFRLSRILGFDQDFTRTDKIVAAGVFFWSTFWLVFVLAATIWNLWIHRWSNETWVNYWLISGIILPLIIAVATLIWFGIGGTMDLISFFRRLATMRRDAADDGTVHKSRKRDEVTVN
jgi:SSS family solute:Na+ symporter